MNTTTVAIHRRQGYARAGLAAATSAGRGRPFNRLLRCLKASFATSVQPWKGCKKSLCLLKCRCDPDGCRTLVSPCPLADFLILGVRACCSTAIPGR